MHDMMGPGFGPSAPGAACKWRSTQRRPMAVVRHHAAAGRAVGVVAIHYLHGADGRDRARRLGLGGAPRHRAARIACRRRRSPRPRRHGGAARRDRHHRNAARRARLQPDAGTAAPADREPHPDAGGAVARSAHAADAAAPAHRGGRRRRRARQDAGDHRRDGRDDRHRRWLSPATRCAPSRAGESTSPRCSTASWTTWPTPACR